MTWLATGLAFAVTIKWLQETQGA